MTTDGPARLIRVVIVDDHAIVRRGLAAYLAGIDGVELVGEAGDGQAALDLLAKLSTLGAPPDVVLSDVKMPRVDGEALIRQCRDRYPEIRVVVVTGYQEAARIRALLVAGAYGYVLKDAGVDRIEDAIRSAAAGNVHLDPVIARTLTQTLIGPSGRLEALSEREREVLVLVARGASNQMIADQLNISERTARTHVSSVITKLGVSSRTQAALEAISGGLVTLE